MFLDLQKASNKIDEEEFENLHDDFKVVLRKKKKKKKKKKKNINSRNDSRFDRKH